nr:imidazole glycerol phosphate synthase subunit HisH [bacterium]
MVAVIDYGAGNLASVGNALKHLGAPYRLVSQPGDLSGATRIILPGVGAFGDAAHKLALHGMDKALIHAAHSGVPLLGICLGMQLMFEDSQESPGVPGLGLFAGHIAKIPSAPGLKIPHMGWNTLDIIGHPPVYRGIPPGSSVYFVHSYHAIPDDPAIVLATAAYDGPVTAAVGRGNIIGMQYHPEKSGKAGLAMLQNFLCLEA